MSSPIYQAIKQLSEEKDIPEESVIETIEAALAAAYRKDFGEKNQNVKVSFDKETGDFDVFDVKEVVEDMELPEEDEEEEGADETRRPPLKPIAPPAEKKEGEEGDEDEIKFNPKTMIMISEAQEKKADAEIGEEIVEQLEVPAAFGRMAAQTAKQVIIQKIREAERNKLFGEFKEREHELVNATVQRREGRLVLIDLGRISGIMPPDEQVPGERYTPGDRIKVYVVSVEMATRGPEVVVSRSHPDIIRKLFWLEIPEIAAGTVTIHAVAREAGARSKVAVSSNQENVDPIGSCIGQRGTRIQTVITELGGEKVDVILHDEDSAMFITNALSPAKVIEIELDEEEKVADVLVDEDQLSLAIGRGGQNVRLASRLTGWKINIRKVGEEQGETPSEDGEAEAVEGDAPETADVEAEPVEETEAVEEKVEEVAEEAEETEEEVVEEAEETEDAPADEAEETEEEVAEETAEEAEEAEETAEEPAEEAEEAEETAEEPAEEAEEEEEK